MDKIKELFASRKFYALIAALAVTFNMFVSGDAGTALNAAIAAFAAYTVGTAIENR
jgi:hypothetical protein